MLTLYDFLSSGNGYKVRLLLTQLEIPFRRVEIDITKGESRTPEFLAKFPNGRIPAVEFEDGRRLFESSAIICYFAEGTPLMPTHPFERARMLQWLFFEQYSHEPNIATARAWVHVFRIADQRAQELEQKRKLGYDALAVMEGHLRGDDSRPREWFVGGRYTIADIALYAYTHVAHEGGFDLAKFQAVRAWLDRVRAQPRHIPITQG